MVRGKGMEACDGTRIGKVRWTNVEVELGIGGRNGETIQLHLARLDPIAGWKLMLFTSADLFPEVAAVCSRVD